MRSMVKRSVYSDHLGRVAILRCMRSMIRSVKQLCLKANDLFNFENVIVLIKSERGQTKFPLMQSKSIFALKAVNLLNLSERSKNDLIKEIIFLEKLKNCNRVVQVKP